jgi:hypothetical protein
MFLYSFTANSELLWQLLHTPRSTFLPSALAFFLGKKNGVEPGRIFHLNLRVRIPFTPLLPISFFFPPRALTQRDIMCFCLWALQAILRIIGSALHLPPPGTLFHSRYNSHTHPLSHTHSQKNYGLPCLFFVGAGLFLSHTTSHTHTHTLLRSYWVIVVFLGSFFGRNVFSEFSSAHAADTFCQHFLLLCFFILLRSNFMFLPSDCFFFYSFSFRLLST